MHTTASLTSPQARIASATVPQSKRPPKPPPSGKFIKWFNQITADDIPLVGGKNASLGEMFRELMPQGVNIPYGFAITAQAYRHLLQHTGLEAKIRSILQSLDTRDIEDLRGRGSQIRHAILSAQLPGDLEEEIIAAYDWFKGATLHPVDVAVRSSATAEDLPDASFAGQQETYLNVQGAFF